MFLTVHLARWNPAPLPYAADSVREAKQAEADRLLSRLDQAKNRGEDYSLTDILQLRATCQVWEEQE